MKTALYRAYDEEGDLLYVGISMRAAQRMHEHKKFSSWFEQVSQIKVEWLENRSAALEAERQAIKSEFPKYNIQHSKEKSEHAERRDDFDADEITANVLGEKVSFHRVTLRPIYKISEAAELLGISSGRVRNLIETGKLGAIDWGRQTRRTRFSEEPKEIVNYRISGWQILDYLDSLGAR